MLKVEQGMNSLIAYIPTKENLNIIIEFYDVIKDFKGLGPEKAYSEKK